MSARSTAWRTGGSSSTSTTRGDDALTAQILPYDPELFLKIASSSEPAQERLQPSSAW
jgi:hypothetical protein